MDFYKNDELLIDTEDLKEHEKLRLKRFADGFLQRELATILGMSKTFLCEIERGERRIGKKHENRIASYLYNEVYVDKELLHKIDEL